MRRYTPVRFDWPATHSDAWGPVGEPTRTSPWPDRIVLMTSIAAAVALAAIIFRSISF